MKKNEIEESYGEIFENSLNEIFIFDAATYKFLKVNRGACLNLGYTHEELTQLTPIDIKPELNLDQFNRLVEPLLAGKQEILQFETVHRRKDSSLYNIEVHLQRTTFLSKPAFVAIILDITDRKIVEQKLQLSAKVFNETHEGIVITDTKAIILDINPAFSAITGYSRTQTIGKKACIFNSDKQSPAFYAEMWKTLQKNGHWQGEISSRKQDKSLYSALVNISSTLDEQRKASHYIGVLTDITQSKKQQEALEKMAHYDALTQLPNRMLLADRFTQAIAHSQRQNTLLAVCFLDLDNFKPVNDRYGHDIGDQLIIQVAQRLKTTIRVEDTVSRQGGDEFILLLGDIKSFSQCEDVLSRTLKLIAQPYVINDLSLSISASIGVSLYPADDSSFDVLMRHADHAMYQAKLNGRNQYFLFSAKQAKIEAGKQIRLEEIRKALVNNELCLYYQPKVNMTTGKVFGVEALIRWVHPEKGLMSPLEFLPVIEETGLEIQLGNWVINEALQQLNHWKTQGLEFEVSINISAYHLQSPLFVAELEKTLALYPKVYSKKLQLEILESSALSDLESISSVVKTCINTLGVNIALDDFGTGYSSLSHLRNLPAQTIKIDQTFVKDILDNPNDQAITDGIIGLASAFNRKVIAEGVETTQHGLILLVMGCNEAQGYGIAKPMPAPSIPEWMNSYAPNQEWINCAANVRTEKESRKIVFRLTLRQWQKHFESHIQSPINSTESTPIMKRNKCHCGIASARARQEQLFAENWLTKLDNAHDTMHNLADDLCVKYQQGEIECAREGLKDFHIAVNNMQRILELCE